MLKNDTLKNGMSRIGLYGIAPPPLPDLFEISFNIFARREQEGSNLFMRKGLIYRSKTFRD